jgi:hypothetical protein
MTVEGRTHVRAPKSLMHAARDRSPFDKLRVTSGCERIAARSGEIRRSDEIRRAARSGARRDPARGEIRRAARSGARRDPARGEIRRAARASAGCESQQ